MNEWLRRSYPKPVQTNLETGSKDSVILDSLSAI